MEAPESNPYCTIDCELEEEPLLLPDARGDVKVPPRGLWRVELEVVAPHHSVEGARIFLEGKDCSVLILILIWTSIIDELLLGRYQVRAREPHNLSQVQFILCITFWWVVTLLLTEKDHDGKSLLYSHTSWETSMWTNEKDRQKMQEAPGQGQMIYVMIIQMYRWRVGEARELQIPKAQRLDDLSYNIESAQVDCDDVG